VSTAAELLAAIERDLDDEAAYLVYADHLLEQGDDRGELIRLQTGSSGGKARRASLEKKHLPTVGKGKRTAEWRWGFISQLTLEDLSEPEVAMQAIARAPACRLVRSLEVLGHRPIPLLPLRGAFPHLTRLRARPLEPATVASIPRLGAPLEEVLLSVEGCQLSHLLPLLELRGLTVLELERCAVADQLLPPLAASPIAATLESLVLSMSQLSESGTAALCAQRAAFPALSFLAVSACRLPAKALRDLRAAFGADVEVYDDTEGDPREDEDRFEDPAE
jgi:uncharacterized protein (TIGR02996 family)